MVSDIKSTQYNVQRRYCIAQNFDGGKFWCFWHFPDRPSKFNLSNCLKKQYSVYRCIVKDSDHPSKYFLSNIWRVCICQNFPLYSNAIGQLIENFEGYLQNFENIILKVVWLTGLIAYFMLKIIHKMFCLNLILTFLKTFLPLIISLPVIPRAWNNSRPLAIFRPICPIWPSKSNLLGQIYCTFPMVNHWESNVPALKNGRPISNCYFKLWIPISKICTSMSPW